ncbi:valine--tRNA ligase [Alphaproteobacteria bacterium]|nr:valine--tRNA ligase [Alphaproteobacteria bacterium]GHS97499.1 valine--tRNA ligase [Alphaproteobacteria bacterium]
MLAKDFDARTIEPKIIEKSKKIIAQTVTQNRKNETFTITLPPPNVTGSLHIGHAFTSVIQDILLRFKRQQGFRTLGQPGLDHAGIATQIVVSKQLEEQGIFWKDLSRAEFIRKVWEWKGKSGGQILHQLTRMGMSIDLERVRFTMDPKSSQAVLKAFTTLFHAGLIAKAKSIVNWDPVFKTALSDLEVSNREEKGTLWHIRYPLAREDGTPSEDFIVVATTRPETLFGDQAVAVHHSDARYQHLLGRRVCLPLTTRTIPLLADEHSDPEKGTGLVKITPAHDFNDFAVGQRHHLTPLNIMDEAGRLISPVPKEFCGLPLQDARKKVLEALESLNLLEKTEPIVHSVPYNDRSGAVVEPRITDQWFLETKKLAERALEAVETGRIKFVPESWANTYFEWLRHIQPWCLSRQIWWGHQIPVWSTPDGSMFCATTEEEAQQLAAAHFQKKGGPVPPLTRDPDVLDTWFSSALWPFSTLGWPEDSDLLKKYYPTNVLVTGFDIIFFWVSRMIMLSLYFLDDVPFKTVYINPLVRDKHGQKMSKSKGNVIDPLDIMDTYGTDAVRLALAGLAIPGRDIRISESLVEMGRNFITKIWNVAKFLEMHQCKGVPQNFDVQQVEHPLNVWIVQKMKVFRRSAYEHLENYRFDLFTQSFQHFLKDIFCDVYIEGIKTCLAGLAPLKALSEILEIRQTAAAIWLEFLKMAHPAIPFVTDFLWSEWGQPDSILTAGWEPEAFEAPPPEKETYCLAELYIFVASEVRSLKGMLDIPPSEKFDLFVKTFSAPEKTFLEQNQNWLKGLCRFKDLHIVDDLPLEKGRVCFVVQERDFCLESPAALDAQKIKAVFQKKIEQLRLDIQKIESKIQNEAYKKAQPQGWAADQRILVQKQNDLAKWQGVKV